MWKNNTNLPRQSPIKKKSKTPVSAEEPDEEKKIEVLENLRNYLHDLCHEKGDWSKVKYEWVYEGSFWTKELEYSMETI